MTTGRETTVGELSKGDTFTRDGVRYELIRPAHPKGQTATARNVETGHTDEMYPSSEVVADKRPPEFEVRLTLTLEEAITTQVALRVAGGKVTRERADVVIAKLDDAIEEA